MQNDLNTMQNKKLVWAQVSQGMVKGGYTRSAQQCRVKKKYRKNRDGSKIPGNLPSLNSALRIAQAEFQKQNSSGRV